MKRLSHHTIHRSGWISGSFRRSSFTGSPHACGASSIITRARTSSKLSKANTHMTMVVTVSALRVNAMAKRPAVKATAAKPKPVTPGKTLGDVREAVSAGLVQGCSPFPDGVDLFGFFKNIDEAEAQRYADVEITHGRVAMLAALGFLVGEQVEGSSFLFDSQVTVGHAHHLVLRLLTKRFGHDHFTCQGAGCSTCPPDSPIFHARNVEMIRTPNRVTPLSRCSSPLPVREGSRY